MKTITLIFLMEFFQIISYGQPSSATIQKDVKNDFGVNCVSVKLIGTGSTSKEYINGGYSIFYRVNVNVILKTDMPGVTKIAKGIAKYSFVSGGKYSYIQYAPGTVEYNGLPAPDTSVIRALILSMSDYGLTQATFLDDVISFSFLKSPEPLWHTLLSVSVPVSLVFTRRIADARVETVKRPYLLRLYRKSANEPWTNVAWTIADQRMYDIREESLSKETMGEYKLSKMTYWAEKSKMKDAEKIAAARPKVDIPIVNNMKDVFKWFHALLLDGDYAKVEAAFIQLLHPDLIDNRTKLINANAVLMLERIKKVLTNDFSTYKKQYCSSPIIFELSDSEITWWNKDKTKNTSIKIKTENNRWYIYSIASYLWTFYEEAQANVTMNTACK